MQFPWLSQLSIHKEGWKQLVLSDQGWGGFCFSLGVCGLGPLAPLSGLP